MFLVVAGAWAEKH